MSDEYDTMESMHNIQPCGHPGTWIISNEVWMKGYIAKHCAACEYEGRIAKARTSADQAWDRLAKKDNAYERVLYDYEEALTARNDARKELADVRSEMALGAHLVASVGNRELENEIARYRRVMVNLRDSPECPAIVRAICREALNPELTPNPAGDMKC